MCGIFGVIGGTRDDFLALGERNTERGNLGFGGLFIDALHCSFRYAEPFNASKVPTRAAPIMLGHVRAPTGGRSANVDEVHPFETADFWLAHNGLLLNATAFQAWNPIPALKVDSLVIIGGIQQHRTAGLTTTEAIRATAERLEGQQACWLWDKMEAALYLWRVMSPIYVSQNSARGIYFSSVKDVRALTLLEEGVIYRLGDQGFAPCGTFSYHNPYR
jgi:predicted glutamine amidotransferase